MESKIPSVFAEIFALQAFLCGHGGYLFEGAAWF